MNDNQREMVQVAMDRLRVDLLLIEANFDINPGMAGIAMLDIERGIEVCKNLLSISLILDPAKITEVISQPEGDLSKAYLDALKVNNIDLSKFGHGND